MKALNKVAKVNFAPLYNNEALELSRRKGSANPHFSTAGALGGAAASALGHYAAEGMEAGRGRTALKGLSAANAVLGGINASNAIRGYKAKKKYKHLSDSQLEKLVKSKHG